MNTLILIIVIAALAGFTVWTLYKRKKDRENSVATNPEARQAGIINSLTVQTMPITGEQPFILSQKELSPQVLRGIRRGFAERIAKARDVMGWSNGLDPAIYTVLVFPAVRENNSAGAYEPSFQVFFGPGNAYDGSIYDQEPDKPGGWTYAAEQVLVSGGKLMDIFIIADNTSEDYSAVVTANGLDHLFAYKNDLTLYYATQDHSKGGGHPLW